MLGFGGGELEGEGGADADGAFDADAALVLVDDFAASGEADARAAFAGGVGAGLGRVEAVEDVGQLVGRDAAAGVADGEVDGACGWIGRNADENSSALGHGLPGVGEQIQEDLLNLIAADVGGRRGFGM